MMFTTQLLSHVAKDIRYGYTASAEMAGTHRFIRITDITDNGFLKADGIKYVTPDEVSAQKFRAEKGDILIARSGSIGRPFLVRQQMQAVFASYLIRFRLDSDVADSEFVFYFALSPQYKEYIQSHGRGGAIKNINAKQLGNLPIPLPDLAEQRRIVARIKECMERVEEIEELRTDSMAERDYLLESLIEAEFQQAQGDAIFLSEVCEITSKLIDPQEAEHQELLHVGGGNIESKTGQIINLKTAREEELRSGKFVFDESMVLYNKIRPYLMKVARPDFCGLCSADMYPFSPYLERLTRDYLFYLFLSRGFTRYAIDGSNRAGIPKVNRKHLFAFKFRLPSIEDQIGITQSLDSAFSVVEELRHNMMYASTETDSLRESILRKAFAGGL